MKILQIGAFEAKSHLSELLQKVRQGQSYIITRRGKPLAELRPAPASQRRSLFGSMKGKIKISSDFDAPLPDFKEYE